MAVELLQTDKLVVRSIYTQFNRALADLGYRPNEENYSVNEGERWESDRELIIKNRGFCIDLFSESSQRSKGLKNMPRIVIFLSRVFDGEVGYPVNTVLEKNTEEGKKYVQGFLAANTANLIIAVHLLSITSEQTFLLNAIWSSVLGVRKFVPYYEDEEQRFLTYQSNYADLDNHIENFNERAYFHTIPDCILSAPAEGIEVSPLKEIKVEDYHKDDNSDTLIVE